MVTHGMTPVAPPTVILSERRSAACHGGLSRRSAKHEAGSRRAKPEADRRESKNLLGCSTVAPTLVTKGDGITVCAIQEQAFQRYW